MSGHSKWSTIKRKKGAADAKRGKMFTRCIHEITVAVKEGGADPAANSRLRIALDKAKSVNMPGDTVDRAMKRASGELKGEGTHELIYEGYGPGGTAILVEAITDNKNRTASEVRHAFTKYGGSLGAAGCVSWMFSKKGLITITKAEIDEESLMELALPAGAEDIRLEDETWEVIVTPASFEAVRVAVEGRVPLQSAELTNLANNYVPLGEAEAETMMKLLEALEDLDDVVSVSSNCDFVS